MYLADVHIHSKYSMATSRDCDLPHLDLWARKKGIGLVGTGDFTHPAWRQSMAEALETAEAEGLYRLKASMRMPAPVEGAGEPLFVITGEISSIYKRGGKTRRVHNLILLPSLEAANALAKRLESVGNLYSDGRPILKLDSRDLLEITLETCPGAMLVPAHIWTPHYALLGALSGFDAVEECFADLTPYIHALETGLSSDPSMNRRVSALDRFQLISNSDAHSPIKLGREANSIGDSPSYPGLRRALERGEGLLGTIEFFPEEGKYYSDGHRACGVCLTPQQADCCNDLCPVCGKKLTMGVSHRICQLADRPAGEWQAGTLPFESLSPLPQVIAASTGMAPSGKKTAALYEKLLMELGPELPILRQISIERISRVAGPLVAEGIRRLRAGKVQRIPGYDGALGQILLFDPGERERYWG